MGDYEDDPDYSPGNDTYDSSEDHLIPVYSTTDEEDTASEHSIEDNPEAVVNAGDSEVIYDPSALNNEEEEVEEEEEDMQTDPPASPVTVTAEHPQPFGEACAKPTPKKTCTGLTQPQQGTSAGNESMDEDGQICTICFEPWTNSSEHRLVSLRCGHLFGRSCITRWLKGQNAKCPQCNARARKCEIRNIYAKSVKVMDSTERDQALQDLQKENELRRKAEMDLAQQRMQHRMAVQECEQVKRELTMARNLLQEYRCNMKLPDKTQASNHTMSVFSLEYCIEIDKQGSCRIVDVCDVLGMALVTQSSTNRMFPGFGFRKISTSDMKPTEFVLVHQKPIRDMAFHTQDGLVLTASLDQSIKITNVLTNSVVHTYPVDTGVWSCCWDSDDPTYFYAGLKTGEVRVFDIRMTSSFVHQLPDFGSRTPVVSLQYLRKSSCSTQQSKCGPVVGKLSHCSFYQKSATAGDYKILPLPTIGPYTSLSSEPLSGHFLVSSRPSPKQPTVMHTVCELASDAFGGDLICNTVRSCKGGLTQVQLTRAKLLPHPKNTSSLLICAGDEDAGGALIWDGSSGNHIDHLKTESPVLDLADFKANNKSHLFTLTDKTLRFYSWKE